MSARILLRFLLLALLALPVAARAHETRPALIRITETGPGDYDVMWKQPIVGDMALQLRPRLSSNVLARTPTRQSSAPGFIIRFWQIRGGPPLEGQTVSVDGLSQTVTDVMLSVTRADGETESDVLRPAAPSLKLSWSSPTGLRLPAYLRLGIEHILTGADHLMFVLGLLLLIGANWTLVKAVSAFTVAHSITLALAALGFVHFPSAIIEALVALSILFVACELLRPADAPKTLTRRHPWVIAFLFGLLHGLAFSGVLAEIGLPPGARTEALLLFNLGVEVGQLLFIAAALVVIWAERQIGKNAAPGVRRLAQAAPVYVIGGFSAFWLIERVMAVVEA
jgi:hypothetical protein